MIVLKVKDWGDGKINLLINSQWGDQWFKSKEDLSWIREGSEIECSLSTSQYNNKAHYWINDLQPQQQHKEQSPPSAQARYPDDPVEDPFLSRMKTHTPDQLRFISNMVGQAISSKTISDPSEMSKWALAAHNVLDDLEKISKG